MLLKFGMAFWTINPNTPERQPFTAENISRWINSTTAMAGCAHNFKSSSVTAPSLALVTWAADFISEKRSKHGRDFFDHDSQAQVALT